MAFQPALLFENVKENVLSIYSSVFLLIDLYFQHTRALRYV